MARRDRTPHPGRHPRHHGARRLSRHDPGRLSDHGLVRRPNTVLIGCGRMYVDGSARGKSRPPRKCAMGSRACRAFRVTATPPQSPPPPSSSNTIDFAHQPYLPGASAADRYRILICSTSTSGRGPSLFSRTQTLSTRPSVSTPPAGSRPCGRSDICLPALIPARRRTPRLRIQPRPPACSAPMSSPIHRSALAA